MDYLLHDIVKQMVEAGVEPVIIKEGLRVSGFYKSGDILLVPMPYGFVAKARYNEETIISTFDELVSLNHDWWMRSKTRFDGWVQPGHPWADEMVRLGYVQKKIIPATEVYE